ncbi:MAG: hypothetical protein CL912_32660 [Deltaproteobacteria bacterium]|nr:hypothetical protein [Deltaproteobacteria bacterium]
MIFHPHHFFHRANRRCRAAKYPDHAEGLPVVAANSAQIKYLMSVRNQYTRIIRRIPSKSSVDQEQSLNGIAKFLSRIAGDDRTNPALFV